MAGPNIQDGGELRVLAGNQSTNVVLGDLTVQGETTFNTDVYVQGTLTVNELTTEQQNIVIQGTATIGETLDVTGVVTTVTDTNVGGVLNVTGASNLTGVVTTTTDTNVGGNLSVTGTTSSTGTISGSADIVAATGVTATTGGVTASAGNIIATTGNINATAGNVSAGGSTSGNTVYSVAGMTAGTGLTVTTGNLGVTAGNITASGTITGSNITGSVVNTGDQTVHLNGDVTGTSTNSAGNTQLTTTLANTTVTPGTYNFASLTVDSKGRLTFASTGTPVTSVSIVSANGISGSVGGTATAPAITLSLGAIAPTSLQTTLVKSAAGTALAFDQNATQIMGWDTNGYLTLGNSGGRISFYGVTPVARAGVIATTTGSSTTAQLSTAINAIIVAIQALGLTS